MQKEAPSLKQLPKQPLLVIEEAKVAIFPHHIVRYHPLKHATISSLNTHHSLTDAQLQDQTLSFSNSDLAFRVIEHAMVIQLLTVKQEKVELEFSVHRKSTLALAQDLLRRKLCELGFEEKFVKIRELGKGATAKVWLVERRADRKQFAAKVISIKDSDNKSYETFINETRILRSLKNPNIVGVESLYIARKELICVLEFLSGGTLLEELREDRLQSGRAKVGAVRDIAQGIQHLRQKRIVHRDLKLQNIMVRINPDASKTYVLTDFGLACWIGERELLYEKCGTPGYIAPEILRSGKHKIIVSHVSDMFSFGVICHFIFMLKSVFPYSSNPKELLMANKKANFSLNARCYLSLLASQHDILRKTLEIDPEKRVSSDEILKVWIKDYEKEVSLLYKEGHKKARKPAKKEEENDTTKRLQSRGASIEIIEKRATSIDKSRVTRIKTEVEREKKEGSMGKLLSKMWSTLTPTKKGLRRKEEGSSRKLEMRGYVE